MSAAHLCTSGLTVGASSADSFCGGVDGPPDCRPLRLLLAVAVPSAWLGPVRHGSRFFSRAGPRLGQNRIEVHTIRANTPSNNAVLHIVLAAGCNWN